MAEDLFEKALKAEGITGKLADLARSIYTQESGAGKNTKTSNAGARGGMQILPGTFKEVADKGWDIDDPMQNARAGIRYLGKLNKLADGDPTLTAAGYYGGPGGIEKAKRGIGVADPRNPKAPDTLKYAQQVVSRMPATNPLALPDDAVMIPPQMADMQIAEAPMPKALPYVASETVPVVAQAPAVQLAAIDAKGIATNPWLAFQRLAPNRLGAKELNFGNTALATGSGPMKPDFSKFGTWKANV